MAKYEVYPIADEHADEINLEHLVLETDDLQEARDAAALAPYEYGGAILDTETGLVDFGSGFGVPLEADEWDTVEWED
jgi:hypothetical protein